MSRIPVIEEISVNTDLYTIPHVSCGQIREDGAEWISFTTARISGWVLPLQSARYHGLYDDEYRAVTTDVDNFPLDLENFPKDGKRFWQSGQGKDPWYVPCPNCYDTSWAEGVEPVYFRPHPDSFYHPELEQIVFYDPDSKRIIEPCSDCKDRIKRNEMNMERYKTYYPTVAMQVREHLRGVNGWNENWVFKELWEIGHMGQRGRLRIGNCERCGIAGLLDSKCFDCWEDRRVPFVNRHGLVVHPCIVSHFCGHYNTNDWFGTTEKMPAEEYLFHWLDFSFCRGARPDYRSRRPGEPHYENTMSRKDIALFRMILEYDGNDTDFTEGI